MPPSPVMRVSPGRELKAENHKRGRSLESGVLYREKEVDLDLALFNEVQKKERESFLLQSNDNFDDIFSSKLRHSSDYTLGISIPARGESSDLLNAEGDKNDYDWLITPPETPLFSCLDDEVPPPNLAPRGRPRSQPVSISRSPTMESAYGSGRGSASPHRLSPSQRSGNSNFQSRSRPSSTHSSPPPSMRHSSPSRRLSPTPSKPTSATRSSTPTPRRVSTGSPAPSRVRGTSPVKTSRGNSASPKIRAWQSNIPGFSSEVPPNLRTSLADRPASYVRGSSPASSTGSRYGRKSMSPTASRSVASSHSHDRDPFNSYSKGSVASSGDDDLDSLQSMVVSSLDRSSPRKVGAYSNNSPIKKPTKVLSSSPKRPLVLQERKVPHNMFRPLLSGVPSSTFHVGKASTHNRSLTSRNSSITTTSDAAFDQAETKSHDTEGSEQNQEDVTSNHVKGHYPDMDDEVFFMDPADSLNEVTENRILEGPLTGRRSEIDGRPPPLFVPVNRNQPDAATAMDTAVFLSYTNHDTPDMATCSKCGRTFHSAEVVMEGDLHLCLECKSLEVNSTITNPFQNNSHDFVQMVEHGSLEVLDQSASIPEPLRVACTGQTEPNHLDKIANETQNSYSDSSQNYSIDVFEEGELPLAVQKVIKQPTDVEMCYQQLHHNTVNSKSRLDVSEVEGISLLLKRSSSMKGHIVQSRSFTASNSSYDDFSYARDSVNSMRSSIQNTSASVSSSIDLGSSRPTEIRIHRQLSGHKSDSENYRYEAPVKHKRSNSSMSGASGHMLQVPSVAPSCREESFELVGDHINKELEDETCAVPHEQSLSSECAEAESSCTDFESNIVFKTNDHPGDTSVLSVLTSQEPTSNENCDDLINNAHSLMNPEASSTQSHISNQEENADRVDAAEGPHPSPLNAISEIEIENDDVFSDLHSDVDSTNSKSELQHYDAITATIEEFDTSHVVLGESTTLSGDIGQTKAKSLTLEEATDAILFCSSIVHNLAYEAANIAIDNDTSPVKSLQPAVTFVGKSIERRDKRLRKRNSKSQKTRQKMLETEAKPPPCNTEMNEKVSPRITGTPDKGDSMKPPKPESKCNCVIM